MNCVYFVYEFVRPCNLDRLPTDVEAVSLVTPVIVQECHVFFGFQLPSFLLTIDGRIVFFKNESSVNTVCKILCPFAN